jgi:hypothetical protein
MPWTDTRDHLNIVSVADEDFARWLTASKSLENVAPGLATRIARLKTSPTRRALFRAAQAAHFAAQLATEPQKTEAVALAEELEMRSVT